MFNNDRVTNKMQPAFGGFGPSASMPSFPPRCLSTRKRTDANGDPAGDPFVIGTGTVGPDASDGFVGNGLGVWEVTVEPLADGKYNFFARFDTPVVPVEGPAFHVLSDPVARSFDSPFSITSPNGDPCQRCRDLQRTECGGSDGELHRRRQRDGQHHVPPRRRSHS